MSWLFSQALVEEYRVECSLDGELCAQLNCLHTEGRCYASDKTTEYSHLSRYGMTFEPLTENRGEELLTWFLEGFRVKTYHAPETVLVSTEVEVGYGKNKRESFGRFDPSSFSWKTHQLSLFGVLSTFLGPWPRWGTIINMEFFPEDTLEPQLKENEFLLPAPTKSMGKRGWGITSQKKRYSEKLENNALIFGYKPHPSILEWSMGWITTWSRLKPLEMDKCQQWLRSHGIR